MIVAALQAEDLVAQARPGAEVRSVAEYGAVVLGGALYAGRWHRDARTFARRHAKKLLGRPVWAHTIASQLRAGAPAETKMSVRQPSPPYASERPVR